MFVRMPVSSDDSYVLVELFTEVALVSYLTLFSGYLPHSFRIFFYSYIHITQFAATYCRYSGVDQVADNTGLLCRSLLGSLSAGG